MSVEVNLCLIGHPVVHSLSPMIHEYWLAQHKIPGRYDLQDVAPEDLPQVPQKLVDEGYTGFNVTIPHKQAVMSLCDTIDEEAQQIRAVNTVIVGKNGFLSGLNTDAAGFLENLRTEQPGFGLAGKRALVLGAGGAARAVIYALEKAGMDVTTTTRAPEKAAVLACDFAVKTAPWDQKDKALKGLDLLVNTTPLGMTGRERLSLDLRFLPRETLVCDIVYRPLMTPLLVEAAARGNPVVTGIGMLLHQARWAFAAWTGVVPEVTPELAQKVSRRAQEE